MIKIPYEDIVERIRAKTGLAKEEIEGKISAKQKQLSGLISKEGAATIIANEFGLSLVETGRLKVKNVLVGMRMVELVARVIKKFDTINFTSGERQGKVCSLTVGDETGTMRVVLWNEQAAKAQNLKDGDIIKVKGAYVKENNGGKEIHLNDRASLIINPENESVGDVATIASQRKKIAELSDNDTNIELLGTVVQVSDLRFFEVCAICNKKAIYADDKYVCSEHGEISPQFSYVLNAVLDDGTDTIRAVFFRKHVDDLLKKHHEQILYFKDFPQNFSEAKQSLLGGLVLITGRVTKNQMFDNKEFIVSMVNTAPDLGKEISAVEEKIAEHDGHNSH